VLERRKQVEEVGRRRLRPRLLGDLEVGALAPLPAEGSAPLAVAAVEDEHGRAAPQAQDVEEVIGLLPVEPDPPPFVQGGLDKQAGS
jgi:hypothetical protein